MSAEDFAPLRDLAEQFDDGYGGLPNLSRENAELLSRLLREHAERGEDAERLDQIEWFGCMTGDCPHETQAECDIAILGVVRSVIVERFAAKPLFAPTHQEKPNG